MIDLRNRRILLVDDNPSIHEDFHKILTPDNASAESIDQEADTFFGEKTRVSSEFTFELDSAFQGPEALSKVQAALAQGEPHAMAFVDMRMPPGWDGLETIRRIWQVHPDLETVICTAYSDHSWPQIQQILGVSDRLLILKKPFDKVEVQQLALNLTEKWNLRRLARQHSEGLNELVRARTAEMIRAHQSKSDFLTNVNHELLTPMNGILGVAELLGGTSLSPEQSSLLADLQQSADRLQTLLNDVLQFNNLEAGRVQLESTAFDLNALCQSAVSEQAGKAGQKELELRLRINPNLRRELRGYPHYIQQVLALLLDNAIKFSDRGSVTLEVAPGVARQNVEFRIVDQGRGISEDRLALLKHPFSQADGSLTREAQGIGMGLTLAKQLVSLMGGWLEIQSKAGQGSTFCVTLPFAQAVRAEAA